MNTYPPLQRPVWSQLWVLSRTVCSQGLEIQIRTSSCLSVLSSKVVLEETSEDRSCSLTLGLCFLHLSPEARGSAVCTRKLRSQVFPDSPGPVRPQSHTHCAGLWDLFLLYWYFHFGDFLSISIDISYNQGAEIFLLFHILLCFLNLKLGIIDKILMWINLGEWGLVSHMGDKVTNDILGKRYKACKNKEMLDAGSSVWGTRWPHITLLRTTDAVMLKIKPDLSVMRTQLGAGLELAVVSWLGCTGYWSSLKNGHRPEQGQGSWGVPCWDKRSWWSG